jgi:hypothetical protein
MPDSFTFQRGWQDKMPPEAQRVFDARGGQLAVFAVQAEPSADIAVCAMELGLHGGRDESDGAKSFCNALSCFLEHLRRPDLQTASLVFFNLRPERYRERLSPMERASPDLSEGIALFCASVSGSLEMAIHVPNLCEWAVPTCTRTK